MIVNPFRTQADINSIVAAVYRMLADLEENTTMAEPGKRDVRKKFWQYVLDVRRGRITPSPLNLPRI